MQSKYPLHLCTGTGIDRSATTKKKVLHIVALQKASTAKSQNQHLATNKTKTKRKTNNYIKWAGHSVPAVTTHYPSTQVVTYDATSAPTHPTYPP